MILKGIEASRYFAKPDPSKTGLLIAGADAMKVAHKRQEVIAALIGPEGEAEMRLTRLSGAALRKDAAALADAVKAVGFFPGPRVVFVEEATDGLTKLFAEVLKAWKAGDAQLIVTAGNLTAKSTLRGLFEKHPNAFCAVLYDDPPTREEIEDALKKAGLRQIAPEAMSDLNGYARALDPGDFRQLLEKVSLYKHGDASPLSQADLQALAPATVEAEVDELLIAVADGNAAEIGTLIRRLEGQGVLPVTICIQALRHYRALHLAATDPGGPAAGLQKARVFGTRRDAMLRQARRVPPSAFETILTLLLDTDLTLRSASKAPQMALVERALIRVAMTRR